MGQHQFCAPSYCHIIFFYYAHPWNIECIHTFLTLQSCVLSEYLYGYRVVFYFHDSYTKLSTVWPEVQLWGIWLLTKHLLLVVLVVLEVMVKVLLALEDHVSLQILNWHSRWYARTFAFDIATYLIVIKCYLFFSFYGRHFCSLLFDHILCTGILLV